MEDKEITKEINNEKKGMSLITLVITIIIVIILAAVVILTLNKNNPIESSNEATFKTDVSTINEELGMYIASKYAKTNGIFDYTTLNLSDTTTPKITDELESVLNSKLKGKLEVQNGKLLFTGIDENEKKWFSEIIGDGRIQVTIPPTSILSENIRYKDKNGKIAVIPKGFKVSSIESEQTIDDGLVIQDAEENEFVWIPVETENNMPVNFVRVDWIINDFTVADTAEDETTAEYIAMKESVGKNGGYYIARYEAGIPGTTESVTTKHNTVSNGSIKPVSKKGVGVWNFIAWGTNNDTVSPGNGAATVARAMHPDNENNKTGVVSTLCYDVQWDSALKFIEKKDPIFPRDSTGKGNYRGTNNTGDTFESIASTGADQSFMINNISDMAGNVWEWTMASLNTLGRVNRGGGDGDSANNATAGRRYQSSYNYEYYEFLGFRIALYIK